MLQQTITSRILKDTSDGVITVDLSGRISFVNVRAFAILDLAGDSVGKKFIGVFNLENVENEAFNDFLLAAIYDKENTHHGKIPYVINGEKLVLDVRSFFLRDDISGEVMGIAITFSDITKMERIQEKSRQSSYMISVLFIGICGYILFWAFGVYVNLPISTSGYTFLINLTAIVMFLIILRETSFTKKEMGLSRPKFKKVILPSLIITFSGTALLVIIKLVLLQIYPSFFPEDAPFLDFSVWAFNDTIYPVTVVLQEFLARSVMQNCLERIFEGKNAQTISLVVSSLIFAVLHISYGFPMMIGSAILLGALGFIYKKQGCIWGVSIIHYFLGEAATFLRFII